MTHSSSLCIHMRDMTHSYVRHDSFLTHSYVRHDSFVFIAHSYVRHDSLLLPCTSFAHALSLVLSFPLFLARSRCLSPVSSLILSRLLLRFLSHSLHVPPCQTPLFQSAIQQSRREVQILAVITLIPLSIFFDNGIFILGKRD